MIDNLLYIIGVIGLYRFVIYSLGDAYNEYNSKAIFADITYYICKKRLEYLGIFEAENIKEHLTKEEKINNKDAYKGYIVARALPIAGAANMLTLCPICTSFYVLFFTVFFKLNIFWFGIALLINKIVFKWT